jgi:hypothetical protein
MHRAYADVLIFIDSSTCEPNLGGTWDGSTNTCTLPSLTLSGDTDLEVAAGVTAVVPAGVSIQITAGRTFTVGSGGILNVNDGRIGIRIGSALINSGTMTVSTSSAGIINDGATLTNYGTLNVSNTGGTGIINDDPTGIITNYGVMNIQNSGGAGIDNPDRQGTLNNFGTLNVSNTGGTGIIIEEDGALNNYGTLNVSNTGGTGILLPFNGDFGILTNHGTLTVNNSGNSIGVDNFGRLNVLSSGVVNVLSGATINIHPDSVNTFAGILFVFCGGEVVNNGNINGVITYEDCTQPSIILSLTWGPPGSQVTVTGTGFAATSAINIEFGGEDIATTPSPLITDSSGAFSVTITIPSTAATGQNDISAQDQAANFDSARFDVTVPFVPPVAHLQPSKDSFITKDRGNVNDGANPQLQVRRTDTQRTLIAFDQSQIAQASSGKTLQSATLKMFITENSNSWGSGRTIDLYLLRTDWTEGNGRYTVDGFRGTGAGVTWNCPTDTNIANNDRNCSTRWSGGSFVSTVSVRKVITNGLTGQVEFDVTNDVKAFLAGTSSNFGWIIKKTQEDKSGHVFFASGEAASNQPVLELRYS